MADYRAYWNSIEIEKTKPFWIEDVSDMKLLRYLREETRLERCFRDSLEYAKSLNGGVRGSVLDVGAGVGWTSAILSRMPSVEKVKAVDISAVRLERIAPLAIAQFQGQPRKIERAVADFLALKDAGPYDAVIFCQSLYMFQDPRKVLRKVESLLAEGGMLIVACEREFEEYPLFSGKMAARSLRRLISGRADASGNHGYTDSDYRRFIRNAGFSYRFQELGYALNDRLGFNAGNHFGLKQER